MEVVDKKCNLNGVDYYIVGEMPWHPQDTPLELNLEIQAVHSRGLESYEG
jgi:hypothetical protein